MILASSQTSDESSALLQRSAAVSAVGLMNTFLYKEYTEH